MDIGLIGLGKMGGNMRERLRRAGHTVVGYDRNPDVSRRRRPRGAGRDAAHPQGRLGDGAGAATRPARRSARSASCSARATWSSTAATPAGPTTRRNAAHAGREGRRLRRLRRLRRGLGPGERLRPDVRRLAPTTSRRCSRPSTRSSPRASSARCTPARSAPATSPRWSTTASSTPIMQAYAEGWELLEKVDLVDNVTEVFRSWREGTVIRSWLLDLLVAALDEDPGPREIRGYAEDSGEGRWTVEAGIEQRGRDARDHRRAVRPLRLPPGRLPRDEGGRRDAQPVRRPRRAHPAARPAATQPPATSGTVPGPCTSPT